MVILAELLPSAREFDEIMITVKLSLSRTCLHVPDILQYIGLSMS